MAHSFRTPKVLFLCYLRFASIFVVAGGPGLLETPSPVALYTSRSQLRRQALRNLLSTYANIHDGRSRSAPFMRR